MRTIQIYKFKELPERIQQKILKYVPNLIYQDYIGEWEFTSKLLIQIIENELATKGFINATVSYRGFGSQGDGLSFTSDIDIDIILEGYKKLYPKFPVKRFKFLYDNFLKMTVVRHSHRYCHENTVTVNTEFYSYDGGGRYINKIEDYIVSLKNELCIYYYSMLQEAYSEHERGLEEFLMDSYYEFTFKGTLVYDLFSS